MPRQYDEIDFILSAMAADPELTLVRVEGENHALASKRVSDFIARAGLDNPVVVRAPVDHRSPLNPKLESYVSDDPSISKMQMFNQYFSYMKNSPSDALRDSYYEKLIVARHEVVDVLAPEKIPATFFCAGEMPEPGSLPVGPEDVCLFACMKNDDQFLERFYGHYKKIGVRRFFVIDDGSDVPIRDLLPHPDVHVFRPKVGDFRTSKGMWMDGLIKAYLPEGAWALTVDADEFIDLPDGYENLGEVVRRLAGQGRDYMPGLLLDLVPGPHVTAEELSRSEERFEAVVRPLRPGRNAGRGGLRREPLGPLGLRRIRRPVLAVRHALSRLRHPRHAAQDPPAAASGRAAPEPGVPHAALHRRERRSGTGDVGHRGGAGSQALQAAEAVFPYRAATYA